MGGDKIHQGQRVIGVGHGAVELPQRQAADPPVIILHELAVDLKALLLRQDLRHVLLVAELALQEFEIGLLLAGAFPIGPAGELHLQQPQFNPHLKHLAAAGSPHHPCADHPRLIGPFSQNEINILILGHERYFFQQDRDTQSKLL